MTRTSWGSAIIVSIVLGACGGEPSPSPISPTSAAPLTDDYQAPRPMTAQEAVATRNAAVAQAGAMVADQEARRQQQGLEIQNQQLAQAAAIQEMRRRQAHEAELRDLENACLSKMRTAEGFVVPEALAQEATPGDAWRTEWSGTGGCVEKLRAVDSDRAASLSAQLDSSAAAAQEAISREAGCRATPSCMGKRIGDRICKAIAWRTEYSSSIAREKSNPAGVVDLNQLHEWGEFLMQANADIKESKKAYTSWTHKAFDEKSCTGQ